MTQALVRAVDQFEPRRSSRICSHPGFTRGVSRFGGAEELDGDAVSEKESASSQMVCEIIWRSEPLVWAEGCCILLTRQDARVAERGDEAASTLVEGVQALLFGERIHGRFCW